MADSSVSHDGVARRRMSDFVSKKIFTTYFGGIGIYFGFFSVELHYLAFALMFIFIPHFDGVRHFLRWKKLGLKF